MNVTIIRATRRKNSSTYNAARYLVSKIHDADEIFEFTLPDDMPHVCCGCGVCLRGEEDRCGGAEYLKPINDAISKSQLVIFCCPVWCYHAPGQIKSFLDHYGWRWLVHRPDFAMRNKQAVIITTAGGGGLKSAAKDIKDSMDYWGMARTYVIRQAVWQYSWNNMPENFKNSFTAKLDKVSAKIQRKKHRMSLKVKCLYNLFAYLHLKDKMWEIDNEYWKRTYNLHADVPRL